MRVIIKENMSFFYKKQRKSEDLFEITKEFEKVKDRIKEL
ncbi:Uncharacterised protein [uncultured archaeon]|nr:Uncharacterised protein [uncultured archaeon]